MIPDELSQGLRVDAKRAGPHMLMSWIKRQVRRAMARVLGYPATHDNVHERVIELLPKGVSTGRVLVAYVIDPFLLPAGAPMSNAHTHHWESWRIVQGFLARGFTVDVISYLNLTFKPAKDYQIFFAARTNLQRIAEELPGSCLKVVHLDTAHWLFNNTAAYQRLLALQQRRGVTLSNIKMVEANWALEHADLATILGNQFTINTYTYAGKPIHRIPISAPSSYDYPEQRNIDTARNHYIWFGSSGFVHKGLDLVVEAFVGMPDKHLHVCGPFDAEAAFLDEYEKELRHTPNIHAHGWVDVAGEKFRDICSSCVGLVYPTASEGGGGSAISCMHMGLIPILSYEASVDTETFGVILRENSIDEIRRVVSDLSGRPTLELAERGRQAWCFARQHHTRESFGTAFDDCVDTVMLPAMRSRSGLDDRITPS
jgi:glycosyltransferase involved in cell wall biosynthesis